MRAGSVRGLVPSVGRMRLALAPGIAGVCPYMRAGVRMVFFDVPRCCCLPEPMGARRSCTADPESAAAIDLQGLVASAANSSSSGSASGGPIVSGRAPRGRTQGAGESEVRLHQQQAVAVNWIVRCVIVSCRAIQPLACRALDLVRARNEKGGRP